MSERVVFEVVNSHVVGIRGKQVAVQGKKPCLEGVSGSAIRHGVVGLHQLKGPLVETRNMALGGEGEQVNGRIYGWRHAVLAARQKALVLGLYVDGGRRPPRHVARGAEVLGGVDEGLYAAVGGGRVVVEGGVAGLAGGRWHGRLRTFAAGRLDLLQLLQLLSAGERGEAGVVLIRGRGLALGGCGTRYQLLRVVCCRLGGRLLVLLVLLVRVVLLAVAQAVEGRLGVALAVAEQHVATLSAMHWLAMGA